MDASETIDSFKTSDVAQSVINFQRRMPSRVVDANLRKGILDALPSFVPKLRVNDSKLESNLQSLIQPILALYERENTYQVIIIRHETPLIFSDSGVVIVFTTGALAEIETADELIGVVAHEIGHEYFAQYSIYTRHLLKINETGRETAIKRHLSTILMILELQCDAFAAISTSSLGYDPLAFVDFVKRTGVKFPNQVGPLHPEEPVRRDAVKRVLSTVLTESKKRSIPKLLLEIHHTIKIL